MSYLIDTTKGTKEKTRKKVQHLSESFRGKSDDYPTIIINARTNEDIETTRVLLL